LPIREAHIRSLVFATGGPLYPERSATVVLAVANLTGGMSLRLTGFGIRGEAAMTPVGLPSGFQRQWAGNHALYPGGINAILCVGEHVLYFPRSVAVKVV